MAFAGSTALAGGLRHQRVLPLPPGGTPCCHRTRDALRCRSVLLTEVEHRLASAHTIPAHTLDLEVSPSVQRRYVEDLEAQWSLDDSDDARAVLDYLQRAVYAQGTSTGLNVVAMSGGTGSALLAHIVASVFDENTVACIGRSGSVASERLHRARYTADLMGVDLWELDTRVAPQPKASLALIDEAAPRSERAVYASLAAISVGAASAAADLGDGAEAVVFCGANAHDLANSARPGLRAAGELGILCPLADLSPETVTVLAQMVGLPDWGHAEVSFSRPRWPMTRHNTPRLARLARSLSSGRLWSKL
ncbi:hypothetical protein COCSUDRAFT_66687 [Coccomyxa subellipsoidea C-169]|uniref:Uncharacterized protein n=1 Tax=Coccomyxa subellipsoidea (strain C-169) TaxID=574566 RepID=I0YTT1_COCSC|nr:hypothetical protein COCSUDRAFT_66687 [Coccomyxa subellipsoidea C-169]EIE21800.1 hypothetical protein COCSUDRAFT_66687 [Coccomyxa subellipsoidea C-169]|eukprot:XP_005646344.1 hypothetical protein COCSUDRAFT_66687 [Coccomyxa subellipsoidea C-169]